MEYIVILIYLFCLVYIYDFKNYKFFFKENIYVIFILLVLIAGLRYRMAPDSVAYMTNFNLDTKKIFELDLATFQQSRYQPLWILLNSFCKTFGNYYMLQISASLIFNFCVFVFFYKTTKKIFTSILFYFVVCYLYFNMEIVRESIAIGFFLMASLNYKNGRYIYYYLYLLVAFLFHHFAAVLFFLTFFINPNRKLVNKIILLSLLIILVNLISSPLLILDSYLSVLSTVDIKLYELEEFKISISGYLYMLLKIAPVFYGVYYAKKHKLSFGYLNENIVYSLSFLYSAVVIIRFTAIPFIERVSNYFLFFVIILIVTVLYNIFEKRILSFFRFSVFTLTTFLLIGYQLLPYLEVNEYFGVPLYKRYYPYYSIISKQVDSDRELMTEMEGKE